MMYIAGSGTPYWYEWEVGLLECLKMMTDSAIQSVVLQSGTPFAARLPVFLSANLIFLGKT